MRLARDGRRAAAAQHAGEQPRPQAAVDRGRFGSSPARPGGAGTSACGSRPPTPRSGRRSPESRGCASPRRRPRLLQEAPPSRAARCAPRACARTPRLRRRAPRRVRPGRCARRARPRAPRHACRETRSRRARAQARTPWSAVRRRGLSVRCAARRTPAGRRLRAAARDASARHFDGGRAQRPRRQPTVAWPASARAGTSSGGPRPRLRPAVSPDPARARSLGRACWRSF